MNITECKFFKILYKNWNGAFRIQREEPQSRQTHSIGENEFPDQEQSSLQESIGEFVYGISSHPSVKNFFHKFLLIFVFLVIFTNSFQWLDVTYAKKIFEWTFGGESGPKCFESLKDTDRLIENEKTYHGFCMTNNTKPISSKIVLIVEAIIGGVILANITSMIIWAILIVATTLGLCLYYFIL